MGLKKGWNNINFDKLIKADWNYKEEDSELLTKLINNIKRNGQIENIIVRELDTGYYEVVNGNHRLDAFLQLNYKTVHVYNLGIIPLSHAQRIAVETNETKFATDSIQLSKVIKEIMTDFDIDDLSNTMPYTPFELESMEKLIDFDWSQFESDSDNQEETSNNKTIVCPHCNQSFDLP